MQRWTQDIEDILAIKKHEWGTEIKKKDQGGPKIDKKDKVGCIYLKKSGEIVYLFQGYKTAKSATYGQR